MISSFKTNEDGQPHGFSTDTFFSIIWSQPQFSGAVPHIVLSTVIDWLEYSSLARGNYKDMVTAIKYLEKAHDILEQNYIDTADDGPTSVCDL